MNDNPSREYHYVLTLLDNGRQATAVSLVTVGPGETRQDVFLRIFNEHVQGLAMNRPTVLFWSLEPNALRGDQ